MPERNESEKPFLPQLTAQLPQNPKMYAIRSLLQSRHLIPPARSLLSTSRRLSYSTSGGEGGGPSDEWDLSGSSSQPPPQPPSSTETSNSADDWGDAPSWSSGSTKDHFDGFSSNMLATVRAMDDQEAMLRAVDQENIANEKFVDGWDDRLDETCDLLKQVTLFVDDWIFDMR